MRALARGDDGTFYDSVAPFGNVSLLHFTDCHAQLLPTYYREPSVNLGVSGAAGKPPHLVGDALLKHFAIAPATRDAHAFTYLDYERMLCPQFDLAFTALIEDLGYRGMLNDTVVCVLSEFGRTPGINPRGGRDHRSARLMRLRHRIVSVTRLLARGRAGHVERPPPRGASQTTALPGAAASRRAGAGPFRERTTACEIRIPAVTSTG